ncbi:Small glutamine-rich tetratricopeptide repeat-containing alpha [Paramuricea clavata]|uniref:Small glutamine-rich tetratricopeptide repeat-containing alpha n=2 Tax=Paramuricea clavata TaxID=317549 RepID=A0A6S7I4B9_PARCT|nr:Small glutamine-rich tetratricopeptide repeat-containing alpha [Paramuricea clavata]
MTTLLSNISELQSNLNKEIDYLRMRVNKCEIQGNNNSLKLKGYEMLVNKNCEEIKLLDERANELSRYRIKEEEKIPYVFTAPPQNNYFAGRTEQIQELKRILKVEETMNEKEVRVAAVCGLGGIGKTSLVSEYAHQMKDFYKGGVYWFSAEDDTHLSKTVNAVAVRIGALLNSFDLTLPNILKKISTIHHPCLIVLDCLDQLDLSRNMMEFISLSSQENIFGHFIVLTRRNPKRLVNEVSVFQEDSCLQLKCLLSQEAKQFLFSRSKVVRDKSAESLAEYLCEELGRLPLALEQAGAYIQMCSCSFALYLEQYKVERLRLLSRQQARAAGNDSPERLAVHTTWLINMEYIKKNPNGQAAVRFMNACSFFDGNEIDEELMNIGTPAVEDVAYRKCVSSPLGCREVLKLLTDFSLFTYVEVHSVSTHRLVQELVWESLTPESKAESFIDAVRMLSFVFSKCFSPSNHVTLDEKNDTQQNIISFSDPPSSPSHFFMWSKFCMHGHYLCRNMENLLVNSVCLDSLWFPETAKILYECAVHLSANHKHEEAKRILNFAYRILDWLPLAGYETVERNVSNNFLFPLPIPLPKPFQLEIQRCSRPPFVSLEALTEKPDPEVSNLAPEASDLDLKKKIENLRFDGNKCLKESRYKEALNAYSLAINLAQKGNIAFNPLLLINRATAYIKLGQYEDALKDANDYITRSPDCWMGYALKALALDGLNEKVSAEIAAALAFYHNKVIFSDFLLFKNSFVALKERIFICDSVEELRKAIFSDEVEADVLKILVLGSEEYILNSETIVGPWDRCVLVGTRNDCSVSLKSNYVIPLLKCMLTNISFYLNKGSIFCMHGSVVKILNCNFTSYDDRRSAVVTLGDFNADQCSFTSTKDSGLYTAKGNALVVGCSFLNNGKVGLEVREGGTLKVKSSRIHNNGRHGLVIGPEALECVVINCDIHHNVETGIAVLNSTNVTLIRNNVFNNYDHGIYVTNCEADIRENNSFDNGLWGIWSQNNSCCNISTNRVFRNKAGGVCLVYRAAGKEFSRSVIELNNIYDNVGPGFVEKASEFEVVESLSTHGDMDEASKSYLKPSSSYQSAKSQNNRVYNNRENENVSNLNCSVPYCSHCHKKCEPKRCGKCFTAAYCSRSCQENHWSKHKKICKVLREKSSYLITSIEKAKYTHAEQIEGRKEIGPKFSPPPPRDGRMFVVKVHTALREVTSYADMLYDRSLELCGTFDSRFIDELLEEFGVQCERRFIEKKLYFYCLFEDNGQLRLFTNVFPKFQNW